MGEERAEQEQDVPGAWNIAKRFRIAEQFDLYVAWFSETASSHATQVSATSHLHFSNGKVHLLRSPQEPDTDAVLNRCAVVALIALRAMGEAMASDYRRASVDRLEAPFLEAFERAGTERLVDNPSDDVLGRFEPHQAASWTPHDAGHVMQLGRAQALLPATRRPVHKADRAGERSLCSMRRDPLRAP